MRPGVARAEQARVYVRISLVVPERGKSSRAGHLLDEIVRYCAEQPGCVHSYRLELDPASGLTGRVTVWSDERHADQAARSNHMLALRAKLNGLVRSHHEHGFAAEDLSHEGPFSSAEAIHEVERLIGGDSTLGD